MMGARGKVVEAAGPELVSLAIVLEHHRALDHRVRLVCAVPVHRDVHSLRHSNQQLGCVCPGVDPKHRQLRRDIAQFGDDRLPLQIFESRTQRVRWNHTRLACPRGIVLGR